MNCLFFFVWENAPQKLSVFSGTLLFQFRPPIHKKVLTDFLKYIKITALRNDVI